MGAAAAAMLEGMPGPSDLHLHRLAAGAWSWWAAGCWSEYAGADTVMRNIAVTMLRQAGFSGGRVAEVFGLTPSYVSTLHAAALREGSAALIRQTGRAGRGSWRGPEQERARAWRAQEVSDNEIGRRLGVAGTTVGRRLGSRPGPAGDLAPQQDAPCEPLVSDGACATWSRSRT